MKLFVLSFIAALLFVVYTMGINAQQCDCRLWRACKPICEYDPGESHEHHHHSRSADQSRECNCGMWSRCHAECSGLSGDNSGGTQYGNGMLTIRQ